MKKNKMITLALIAVIALGLLVGCGSPKAPTPDTPDSTQPQQEEAAAGNYGNLKEFSAKTLDGSTFTQEDLKKVDLTVINFWSTSCQPCIQEMPELATIAKNLPENVKMITACLDGDSDSETMKKIISDAKFSNPTLTSGNGDWDAMTKKIIYTPTTIFVDAEGNSVGTALEGAPANQIEESYKDAINEALTAIGKPEVK